MNLKKKGNIFVFFFGEFDFERDGSNGNSLDKTIINIS